MSAASAADDRSLLRAVSRLMDHGAKWKIGEADARKIIGHIVESWRGSGTSDRLGAYLDSLRYVDLALAAACRIGNPSAWETFIETYRPTLYGAARAVCGDESAAREIADSLWAELYGTEIRGGERRSLLDFFHGRSSLKTWMRAVVAQRHVDRIRAASRLQPFDADHDPRDGAECLIREASAPMEPEHRRLMGTFATVIAAVLTALAPRDRARLGYYYREGLTVRQIGRIMEEHEATVSRKLERARREIRAAVEKSLQADHGLSADQIRYCYEHAAEDSPLDFAVAMPAQDWSVATPMLGNEENRARSKDRLQG